MTNTKFTGFGPGNTIFLERWGHRLPLRLPAEAIAALREATYNILPKRPPVTASQYIPARFDERENIITLRVQAHQGPKLAEALEMAATVEVNPQVRSHILEWKRCLDEAITLAQEYNDVSNEPGLDPKENA